MTLQFSFYTIICALCKALFLIILVLISVAYFTLVERKVLAAAQRRRGPNVVGVYGLLQPLADGLKLFSKETIVPSPANKFIFIIAPIVTFWVSLITWVVIPFSEHAFIVDLDLSLLYLLACSATGVYGILMAGWSSNSKYAFLGALRSAAQMVSYEIPLGIIAFTIAFSNESFSVNEIVDNQYHVGWMGVWFSPIAAMFFMCGVAETNRHPFDLPEAEAELVSGYNVEYSAMGFALFSLGEYSNILLMSAFNTILFWGGWAPLVWPNFSDMFDPFILIPGIAGYVWFSVKIAVFIYLFIYLRAGFPRYRYDQLMELGWKDYMLFSIAFFMFMYSGLLCLNSLPE